MAIAEKTTLGRTGQNAAWPVGLPTEADGSGQWFGRRYSLLKDAWNTQSKVVRMLLAPPLSPVEDADVAAVTKIKHDEVTLARISRNPGRVVISLTDAQAEQIKRVVEDE